MDSKKNIYDVLKEISHYNGEELYLLICLVKIIRSSKSQIKDKKNEDFEDLLYWVSTDTEIKEGLKSYILRLVKNKNFSKVLTDSDMIHGVNFWNELWDRIVYKFLPDQPENNSIEYILNNVFYKESDGVWVDKLNNKKSVELIEVLGFKGMYEKDIQSPMMQQFLSALEVLSYQISGSAFDMTILKMAPEYENLTSPFATLNTEINEFIKGLLFKDKLPNKDNEDYKQIIIIEEQCRQFIKYVYNNTEIYGLSFTVHQKLMLMERLLDRLGAILDLIIIDSSVSSTEKLLIFIKTLVRYTSGKSKISAYVNKSTQIYAKEITKHIGLKGEQYITTNRKEYWKMFKTALGGGAVVAIACVIKMFLSSFDVSLFGKAFLYSMNYAFAFVSIYVLHLTLATKQPAMTAATLAQAIEKDKKNLNNFETLSDLVRKVFRSQYIAFLGNVVMAFPVAMLIIMGLGWLMDSNPAAERADKLINDLNIFTSPAIFHAAIAGVFLFISGLIAGRVANKNKYKRVPERIKEHPLLKQIMSDKRRTSLARYVEEYLGGITSNFWFGVFMGSTSTIGVILGLDLDIRHITFAAGNFGLGLYGNSFQMSTYDVLNSILGIGVIGFVNFIVSFSLSLILALRSRGIPIFEITKILISVKNIFFKYPFSFFFPPNTVKQTQIPEIKDKAG